MSVQSEKMKSTLQVMGLLPKADDEGDLIFRYNTKAYYAVFEDDDPGYLMFILPNVYTVDSVVEHNEMAKICSKINSDSKAAKLFIEKRKVHISAELFLNDPSKLSEKTIIRYLDTIHDAYLELEKEIHENEVL